MSADFSRKASTLEQVFRGWLDEQGLFGSLVLLGPNEEVARISAGLDAQAPAEMASLSKAITAVCASALVADGTMAWTDTLRGVLGEGPEGVSLRALLAHISGVGPDQTQGLRALPGYYRREGVAEVTARALKRPLQDRAFYYSNENYALAALMIEAGSERPYAATCEALALHPAGVAAAEPSEETGPMLPWGGWRMTIEDYARFHDYWFARERVEGPKPVGLGQTRYGAGMFDRVSPQGPRIYWHFGGICVPLGLNAGSFVVSGAENADHVPWTVVAAYDGCIGDKASRDLYDLITQTMLSP